MKLKTHLTSLTLAAILAASLLPAAQDRKAQDDTDKHKNMITGCLSKATDGQFKLTDETTGKQTSVVAKAGVDMEKHNNHKVTLHGMRSGTDDRFEVTRIEHLAPTCSAPKT